MKLIKILFSLTVTSGTVAAGGFAFQHYAPEEWKDEIWTIAEEVVGKKKEELKEVEETEKKEEESEEDKEKTPFSIDKIKSEIEKIIEEKFADQLKVTGNNPSYAAPQMPPTPGFGLNQRLSDLEQKIGEIYSAIYSVKSIVAEKDQFNLRNEGFKYMFDEKGEKIKSKIVVDYKADSPNPEILNKVFKYPSKWEAEKKKTCSAR